MAENFGEHLKSITIAAIEHNTRLAEEAAAADSHTETGLSPDQEEAEVSVFVEQHLAPAIKITLDEARLQAEQGHWSSRTTWGFQGESDDPELPMNLLRYRGLRDKVVEHITTLGIAATEIDTRSGYPWRLDPPSDVPVEWRPSPYRVIGVEISWGEPLTNEDSMQPDPYSASEIREHLGADDWLSKGQASPL